MLFAVGGQVGREDGIVLELWWFFTIKAIFPLFFLQIVGILEVRS